MDPPKYRRSVLASYLRSSPFRPPSWRWDLGHWLYELDMLPFSRLYDEYVQIAWHAARVVANNEPVPSQLVPVFELQDVYQANGPLRWELEARSLAREDVFTIADKCSMTPRMAQGFQRLFFGVEDRLNASDFIHSAVLRTHQPWLPTDVRKVWLYYAYTGGPALLDQVIDHCHRTGAADYQFLLARVPETRQRSVWDMQWESTLRLRLAEFTPRQTMALAAVAARRTKLGSRTLPRRVSASDWVDEQLASVLANEPTMVPSERLRQSVA